MGDAPQAAVPSHWRTGVLPIAPSHSALPPLQNLESPGNAANPSASQMPCKRKGPGGKACTQALPEKFIKDLNRVTLQKPTLLHTRPTFCDTKSGFVQTRYRWPMPKIFFWGDLSSNKYLVDRLNELSWLSHLEGVSLQKQKWGAWVRATCLGPGNRRLLLLAPAWTRKSRHEGPCFPSSFKLALLSWAGRLHHSAPTADLHTEF